MATKNQFPTSAVERLNAALAKIRSGVPESANAFTSVFESSARREALASDARVAAGATYGPLDGRIVSVKALFDVAGTTTTAGSALLRDRLPAVDDAYAVKRLRAAGAVIVGKTQMTEFAFSALGTNPHDGAPGNPRDRNRVPGGSSSGAVVSVVDGMAEIAIGSDTGGSLRIPAALSGAVGFKPTSGRVSTVGAFSLSSTLDTIGPIALNVADCFAADQVLSGQSSVMPMQAALPDTFRLNVARGRLFDRCEPNVLSTFESAIRGLRADGIKVEDGSIDAALDSIAEIDRIGTFPSIELGATLLNLGIANLDGVDPKTRARIEAGAGTSAANYVRMTRLRDTAVRAFQDAFSEDDVFILPTTPIVAPLFSSAQNDGPFHEFNGLVLRNARIANLLDCPSISLPLPTAGLPIGLMLVGHRNADQRLFAIASCLEAALQNMTQGRLK